LVRAAAGGDDQAFGLLVNRIHGKIYRWALTTTGDSDDAEDVAQEVLLRLHRSLAEFREEAGFGTWLFRITRNVAHSRSRGTARRRSLLKRWFDREGGSLQDGEVGGRADEGPILRIEAGAVADRVKARFMDLPEMQRLVFDLADLQGFAPAEIAEMMEMNGATVRVHLLRARRTLRRWLRDERATPGGYRGLL
jgi:RNA polymerase sigma-70 factor (ECF subfamily)